jgi:sugar O-acyltransferase (sialic acid O-acetyltransferase NeuD family)
MNKHKKLIIVGDSAFAEIAYEYFCNDSDFKVVAFSVEKEFIKNTSLFDLPIVPFEKIESIYNPVEHYIFVAVVYTQLNRLRTRLSLEAKEKGYKLASYISSKAFVWKNIEMGEHCFVFENNVIQPFVKLGTNIVLWSGNHIGHHSILEDNCFVSSHVVISGFARIGENNFLGVNSTISNNIQLAKDCWIGPGVVITKDTKEGELYKIQNTEAAKVSTYRFFKIKE